VIRKYTALLKASWSLTMEYRVGTLVWMLSNTFPLIMLAVWLSLAEEGPVGNYAPADFVRYYVIVVIVRQFTTAWVSYELERQIRLGELSPKLLRPLHPIHEHVAIHLADRVFRIGLLLPLVFLVFWFYPAARFSTDIFSAALAVVTTVIAFGVRFLTFSCIGLLSFWTTQSESLSDLYYGAWVMLGGIIAPLDLLPASVMHFGFYLPFRYMLSLPVEIVLGKVTGAALWQGVLMQIGWLVGGFVLFRLLWHWGVRNYSAVGA